MSPLELSESARSALLDSQINLRRASRLLAELVARQPPPEELDGAPSPALLERAGREIAYVLASIRGAQGMQELPPDQRLRQTSAVLHEVETRLGLVARIVEPLPEGPAPPA